MADKRQKFKGCRSGTTFGAKPHHIFRANTKTDQPSPASVLSHMAAHLLDNLVAQFNGNNNGDLTVAPKIMKLYGWTSQGSVHSALTELLATGFIEQTRQGGRNKCSLYALTWLAIKGFVQPWSGACNFHHRNRYSPREISSLFVPKPR